MLGKVMAGAAGALALLAGSPALSQDEPADLILTGGRITTQAEPAEVEAVAIRDDLIVATGSANEVLDRQGESTRVIDLDGRRVIPGLNDSHTHVVRGGRFYAAELRWDGVPTLERALEMVKEQAGRTPGGQWVRVIGGWSPFQFEEKRLPTPEELTAAAPDTPVFVLYLYSRGFLNRAGLDALGITAENAEDRAPPGTRYELGDDGTPTGVLLAEPNPTLLYQTVGALPPLDEEEQALSTRHFYRELNRFGLTSVIDAGGGGHVFPTNYVGTERLADAGEMPLRVSFYLFPQTPGEEIDDFERWIGENQVDRNRAEALINGYVLRGGGEFLVWSAGDFENFTAPMPDITTRDLWREELTEVTRLLLRRGWPLRIHATYDPSIGHILDVFEDAHEAEVAAGRPGFHGIRWAIDHAETVSRENLERIRSLGGGIAIQNRMAFAGEYFVERYGEEAAASAPPVRDMLELGIPVGVGTDATRVSSYNPWVALHWLVTGETVGGMELQAERHQLTREEALYLYTVGSAWFSGEQGIKGRIAPGQLADLAVLSEDYVAVAEDRIDDIEAVLTVVGGEIVYGAGPYADLVEPLPPIEPEWSPVRHYGGYWRGEAD